MKIKPMTKTLIVIVALFSVNQLHAQSAESTI